MVFRLLDRAQMSVSGTPGTGNISLGVNTTGYQTVQQAGVNDGDQFPYSIADGTAWEYGVATYSIVGNQLTRAVGKTSAQSTLPLSLSNHAIITACVRAEDIAGNTTLAGLSDVSVVEGAAINGYGLTWSNSTGRWIATASGAGGVTLLSALSDVSVVEGSPINGYTLNWNNATAKWVATAPIVPPTTLETLTDVLITSVANGQALVWNSTAAKWENGTVAGGAGTLETLTDVLVTSVGNGQALVWNSAAAKWENGTITGGAGTLAVTNNGTSVDTAATTLNFVNATSITTSAHDVTITLPVGGSGTSSWRTLAFGTAVTAFGETVFPSTTTFSVVAGNRLEIEGYVYHIAGGNAELIASPDGTTGYSVKAQADGNFVFYHYSPAQASNSAAGGNSQNNYAGYYRMTLNITERTAANNELGGFINDYTPGLINDASITFNGTITIYVETDDITKCKVRARVINDATISTIF